MAKKPEVVSKLTAADRKALTKHEETIRDGLTSFIEVGNALAEIRDSELYREEFPSFESYCNDRWDLVRSAAYNRIAAAEVVDEIRRVHNSGHLPQAESQALELAKAKDKAPKVWAEVVKRSPKLADGSPCTTAKKIAAIRDEMLKPMVQHHNGPDRSKKESDREAKEAAEVVVESAEPEKTNGVHHVAEPDPLEDDITKKLRSLNARLLARTKEIKDIAEELGNLGMTSKYPKLRGVGSLTGSLDSAARSCKAVAAAVRDAVSVGPCTTCGGKGGPCKDCNGDGFQSHEERRDADNRRTANAPRGASA